MRHAAIVDCGARSNPRCGIMEQTCLARRWWGRLRSLKRSDATALTVACATGITLIVAAHSVLSVPIGIGLLGILGWLYRPRNHRVSPTEPIRWNITTSVSSVTVVRRRRWWQLRGKVEKYESAGKG